MTGQLLAFANVSKGSHVFEVGAGTGQWIEALLACGLSIDALEPGNRMRAIIDRRFAGNSRVTSHAEDFEHFHSTVDFDAVLASNAFHWVDPALGYERAASMLSPGGALLLVRHFVASPHATALNDQLSTVLPEAHAGLATLIGVSPDLDEWLANGRDGLQASGRFTEPEWPWFDEPIRHDARSLVDLVASYANDVSMTSAERETSSTALAEQLEPALLTGMTNHIYAVTARRLP